MQRIFGEEIGTYSILKAGKVSPDQYFWEVEQCSKRHFSKFNFKLNIFCEF